MSDRHGCTSFLLSLSPHLPQPRLHQQTKLTNSTGIEIVIFIDYNFLHDFVRCPIDPYKSSNALCFV